MTQMARIQTFHIWTSYLHAWIDRRVPEMLAGRESLSSLKVMDDPEAIFQEGWLLCDVGEFDRGLDYVQPRRQQGLLRGAGARGRSQFDAVRDEPAFQAILADGARRPHARARRVPRRRRRAPPRTTMKTLARAHDKEEILRRLKTIHPASPRQWGRMSAHQMICHLSDSFLAVTGQRHASPGHRARCSGPSSSGSRSTVPLTMAAWHSDAAGESIRSSAGPGRPTSPPTSRSSRRSWSSSRRERAASTDRSILFSDRCRTRRGCAGRTSTWIIICASSDRKVTRTLKRAL